MIARVSAFAADFSVLHTSLTDRYAVVADVNGTRSLELATSDRMHALASAFGPYAGRSPAVYKRVTPVSWCRVYYEVSGR